MIRMMFNAVHFSTIDADQAIIAAQANPRRVALMFCPPDFGRYTVSPSGANIRMGKGITLVAGMSPVVLTREQFGDGLDLAWYAVTTGLPSPGTVPNNCCTLESFTA